MFTEAELDQLQVYVESGGVLWVMDRSYAEGREEYGEETAQLTARLGASNERGGDDHVAVLRVGRAVGRPSCTRVLRVGRGRLVLTSNCEAFSRAEALHPFDAPTADTKAAYKVLPDVLQPIADDFHLRRKGRFRTGFGR